MSLFDELMAMGAFPQYASRPNQSGDLAPAYGGREADEQLLALRFMQGEQADVDPDPLYGDTMAMFDDLLQQISDLQNQGTLATPDMGLTDYISWPEPTVQGPSKVYRDNPRLGDESGPFRGLSNDVVPPWGTHSPYRASSVTQLDPTFEWGPRSSQPRRQPGLLRRPRTAPLRVNNANRQQIGTHPRYNS